MRLREFRNVNFGNLADLELEETEFLHSIIARLIEDTEIVVYVLAKERRIWEVNGALVVDALKLIRQDDEGDFMDAPDEAIVDPGMVREYAKAPLPHDDEAISHLSKFVNYQLLEILRAAGSEAVQEGTSEITKQHIFKWCHRLPYPFNVWLC